jgi:hypothetical protein
MRHIDYGLAALRDTVLLHYPEGEPLDLARVYEDLVERGALAPFEVTTRFFEIGTPAGLAETRAHLAKAC